MVDHLMAAEVPLVGAVKAFMKKETASGAFCARSSDHFAWFSRNELIA